MLKTASPRAKVFYTFASGLWEAAWFVILWNLCGVHTAVGLGTINYWTALGVDYVVCSVVFALALAFWSARTLQRHYSLLHED